MSLSKTFDNVIIWGYPYGTHTQSYVWYGFYRAFKSLGIETHWLANRWSFEQVQNNSISLNNTLFIVEKNDMNGMPIHPNCTYMLHMMGNRPHTDISHRFSGKVKRVVDMRQHCLNFWDDDGYSYTMDRPEVFRQAPGCFFEKSPSDGIDKIYVAWATDLLPEEFDFNDMYIQRENTVWYVGTVGGGKGGLDDCLPPPAIYDNRKFLFEFRDACRKNNIEFKTNCPWVNPLSQEESKKLVQRSYLAPDSRHPSMLSWGYVPCRTMKNISYGQLGLTNSPAIQKFFEGEILFNENGYEQFYEAQKHRQDYKMIKNQMMLVKEKHTYVNRAKSILEALSL